MKAPLITSPFTLSACKIGVVLALVALASCASPGPHVPESDPHNVESTGAPIVLLDPDLRRTVSVDENIRTWRDPLGRLCLQALIRNQTTDETLYLQVQTLYRTDEDVVLYAENGNQPVWENVTLTPGQNGVYQTGALDEQAERFTIRIRYSARSQ